MVCDAHVAGFVSGDLSAREIANAAGVSRHQVVSALRRNGVEVAWRIKSEKVEKVLDLLSIGASCREVERATKVSKSSVHRIAKKHASGKRKPHRCTCCGAMIQTENCLSCELANN